MVGLWVTLPTILLCSGYVKSCEKLVVPMVMVEKFLMMMAYDVWG